MDAAVLPVLPLNQPITAPTRSLQTSPHSGSPKVSDTEFPNRRKPGSARAGQPAAAPWLFGAGAELASVVWLAALGAGAHTLAPLAGKADRVAVLGGLIAAIARHRHIFGRLFTMSDYPR